MGRFQFLFFVSVVAASPAVWAQTTGPPCEQWIFTNCLNSTETNYQQHINDLDFDAACNAFKQVDTCYNNATTRVSCANFTSVINGLRQKNTATSLTYCPNGQPDDCLAGMPTCFQDLNKITDPQDQNLCAAATNAKRCLDQLDCPSSLNIIMQSKLVDISRKVLQSGCIQTNATSPTCLKVAAKCLDPLEKQILTFEQNYDFGGLCQLWPQIQTCMNKLNNDPSCASFKSALDARWTTLQKKHSTYCDAKNKPMACLQALQNCTDEYRIITGLPQFNQDPLYLCQGLERLMACMGTVDADLATCPGAVGIKAIASYQKDQAETQQLCSQILTPCTNNVSMCVLTTDIAVNTNAEAAQFDRVCQLTDQLENCVSDFVIYQQCVNNPLLQAEATYATNVSKNYCQSTDDRKPKPCLAAVETCVNQWLKVALNFANVDQLCRDQVTYVACLDKISCTDQITQSSLIKARQKAEREECNSGVTLAASLTLLVAMVLRLVVA